jgi:predicted DNA-binding ribbon-helix-helix protein
MSGIVKRSMSIRGHRTSISLEDAFFEELTRLADERSMSLAALVAQVDATRDRRTNLSSALRLFVLDELKRPETADQ